MLVYIASCRLFYRAIICRLFVSWVLNNFPRDFIKGVQWSNYKVECVSCATSPFCNYPPPDIPTWPIFSPSPMPVHCVTNLIYHHCCFHRYLIYHHYLSPLLLSPIHHAQHRPTRFAQCRRRPCYFGWAVFTQTFKLTFCTQKPEKCLVRRLLLDY